MRYVFSLTVQAVYEQINNKRGYKDAAGDSHIITESGGWFVVLEGNFSLRLGDTKPDLVAGQKIKMIVETI